MGEDFKSSDKEYYLKLYEALGNNDRETVEKLTNANHKETYTPKCPTCGSPQVVKITGSKRWLTTGIFGLGSSNLGKTMECKNCGYKW